MGVSAGTDIKKGKPLLFYVGELLTADEGRNREQKYTEKDGSFSFLFTMEATDGK